MASEQERKEAFLKVWFDAPENIHWAHGMSNGVEKDISDTFDRAIAAWNTRPAPAATDTGLETVEHQALIAGDWVSVSPEYNSFRHGHRELVTRSQAEELLAAERAKKEMLAESLHIQIKRVNELEADNAALTARIKELEKECDDFCADLNQERKSHESAHNRAEDLKAKLAAAEKALEVARPYVEDYDTRRHNTGVDETLTQIDAVLGGKPS